MFYLLNELKKYNPYDKREQEDVQKTISFLENSENCYDRSNLIGHVTAGAFVADNKGNILLNHHKESGWWFQFGGHSDKEENSLSVAEREVFEECGIKDYKLGVPSIFDVTINEIPYSKRKNEPEHLHYDINFLFIVDNYNYVTSNESIEIKWVTIDEALQLVDKEDVSMIRMIKKYKDFLK